MNRLGGHAAIRWVVVACAAAAPAWAYTEEPPPLEEIVAAVEPATLVIYGTHRETGAPIQGTGICVDPRGLVLVTAHQVKNATDITGANDDFNCELEVIAWDLTRDLALLRAEPPPPTSVTIGDASGLALGATVFVLSSPRGIRLTLTTGAIATTGLTVDDQPRLQVDMALAEGSSGGPVFDRRGHLVGVVTARAMGLEGFTLISPVNEAYKLLSMQGVPLPEGAAEAMENPAPPRSDEARQAAIDAYNRGVEADSAREKVRHYQAAVGYAEDFFEAWFNLGAAHADLGESDKAAAAYHTAHQLRPDSEPALRNYGQALLLAGDARGALRVLGELAARAPDDPRLLNDLGEAYRRLGQVEQSARQFERALALDPSHAPAQFNLALAYMQLEQKEEALAAFERYLSLRPDAPDADRVKEAIDNLRKELP